MLGLRCYLFGGSVILHFNNFVPVSVEVADVVLNNCVEDNGTDADGADHQITLCFEFLEDIYLNWSKNGDDAAPMEDTPEEDELVKELEKKENHPLMIMVSPPWLTS